MSLSNQVDPALKKDEERATSFVENVDSLTSATVSVQGPARNIDATSTSVTEGPIAQVVSGLKAMSRTANRHLRKVQAEKERFREKEAQHSILSSYKDFTGAHAETLSTLTGKIGIITKVPSAKPAVRSALAEFGASMDVYAQALLTLIPDVAAEFAAEHKKSTALMRATVQRFA